MNSTALSSGDPRVVALIQELRGWPGPHISSHRSASQFFHKLAFLADIGLKHDDPGIAGIVDRILSALDEHGVPCLSMDISVAHGGAGISMKAWALCDAPTTLYTLKTMGVIDPRIDAAVRYLAKLPRAGGYGCAVSEALGEWRGPGKKSDPCPYATLVMLKLLILYRDEYAEEIAACAECLLDLWENSATKHPYIFYMGTDFRKLKLPTIWYDILHVADVLSQVKGCGGDQRFLEMIEIINAKKVHDGFIPESIYQPWKAWDFGQKKHVSRHMTDFIVKINQRLPVLGERKQ